MTGRESITDMVGNRIGRYNIVEKIGQGGMAVVYKAQDTRLKRFVALKLIKPGRAEKLTLLKRFQREGQALAGSEM